MVSGLRLLLEVAVASGHIRSWPDGIVTRHEGLGKVRKGLGKVS